MSTSELVLKILHKNGMKKEIDFYQILQKKLSLNLPKADWMNQVLFAHIYVSPLNLKEVWMTCSAAEIHAEDT